MAPRRRRSVLRSHRAAQRRCGARACSPQPPEPHRAPARSVQGRGSRVTLAAPAARGAPTRRQSAGGRRPAPHAAGAGNRVKVSSANP